MIKEYLFLETNDSCALCGQRGNLTEHHIDENHTNDDYDNRIILCAICHARYNGHVQQEENDPKYKNPMRDKIRERKRRLIKKTLTQYGVNAIKRSARDNFGLVAIPFLVYHLVDLGFLKEEETQMFYGDLPVLVRFSATQKGRDIYYKWLKD